MDLKILGAQLRRPLNNNRGIAIMIAIACMLIITYIAIEVTYDTNIEYAVNANGMNRIKSYYAAKAGIDIALLRIKIFQKAQSQFGKQLGSSSGLLDEIWRFPFAWPLPVTEEINAVEKDNIQKLVKESIMDASYIVTIEDEGSKLDLNDLVSPSKALRDNANTQLLAIFQQKVKDDDEFARKYSNTRFEEVVGSIEGWMSSTSKTSDGKDKMASYSELNSKAGSSFFPPNRAFRTLAELRMVPEMNDDFFDLLEPVVTIYGMKGINPNLASKAVLKSLDPGITEEVATELVKRREDNNLGGPYKDAQDFWGYAQSKGAQTVGDTSKIPLIFESIMNFRIRSTGQFGNVTSEITAIVMDVSQTASKIKSFVDKEKQSNNQNSNSTDPNDPSANPSNPGGGSGQQNNQNQKTATDAQNKGPPRIVYWSER